MLVAGFSSPARYLFISCTYDLCFLPFPPSASRLVCSEEIMDACDEWGIMVIDESPAVGLYDVNMALNATLQVRVN